jgi:DNA-binding transcriptional ArsR family regulator
MIVFRFDHDDLLRTRFAISPLFEALSSVAVMRDPAGASLHLPWVRAARPRLGDLDVSVLQALVPHYGYTPDFISPPPASPLPDVWAEIERVRATPLSQVRRELGYAYPQGLPAVLEGVASRRGLSRLADLIGEYWTRALEPDWPEIQAVLEDDIAHRARALTAGGALAVFGDLHPDVSWRDGTLVVDRPVDQDVDLGGRGLQLVPSVFMWPRVAAMFDPPWQPAVLYPPRGVGRLWAPAGSTGSLEPLLGARRAAILCALDVESSTTTLARRLGASAPSVSEHLGVLRDAGLVRGRREGRSVLYARTAAGDALVAAPARSAPA